MTSCAAKLYAGAGIEPPLEEVLCDPIVQLLMQRDGVHRDETERLLAALRRSLMHRQSTYAIGQPILDPFQSVYGAGRRSITLPSPRVS